MSRTAINKMNPTGEKYQLGAGVVAFQGALTAAANSADVAIAEAPFDIDIFNIIVRCTATKASGTIQPKKNGIAMCTAITCDTEKGVTHLAAGAEVDKLSLKKGDVVAVRTNAAEVRGALTFVGVRP